MPFCTLYTFYTAPYPLFFPCIQCIPCFTSLPSHRVFVGEVVEGRADGGNEVERKQDGQKNYSDKDSHHHQCVITQPYQATILLTHVIHQNTSAQTLDINPVCSQKPTAQNPPDTCLRPSAPKPCRNPRSPLAHRLYHK